MVGRPQAGRSAIGQFLTDDIGVEGAQTAAEQHEIDPPVEIDRCVLEVRRVAPGIAELSGMRGAPGIREPSLYRVTVSLRARPVRPRVVVTSQDHREPGLSWSAEDLVALGYLDRVYGSTGALWFEVRVDEPECNAAHRSIHRTPSARDRNGLTGS